LNLIQLDLQVRPTFRGEIVESLRPLLDGNEKGEIILTPIDQWYLDKLKVEFKRELELEPKKIADRPLLEFEDLDRYFTLDTRLSGFLLFQENKSTARIALIDLDSYGSLGRNFVYDEEITVSAREGDGNQDIGFSDAGVRDWKDVRASIERAYFVIDLSGFQLEIGRNRKWWGPGRFGSLLISSNAPPMDLVQLSTRIWRIQASAFTALLSPDDGRFLSNHRLAIRIGDRTIIGVSEAVLYNRQLPEFGYVNPIIPYYATQRNVNKDDNIFWYVDFSTFLGIKDGMKVYGEFLIDDFQYSSRDSFPDKIGGIIGFQWYNPFGLKNTDLEGEVGRIQKWVYTHRKQINTYLHDDLLLGDGLGPDAERIVLVLTHRFTNSLTTMLEGISIRRGEGRDLVAWEVDRPDPRPPFPSGVVERRMSFGVGLEYEPIWWIRLSLLGRMIEWKNKDNLTGMNSDEMQLQTGVEINF
jgi:hypothetical protein